MEMKGRPIIVGEVLFDCFDDGREVLGGAPFNVAWHLHAFGAQPLLISRVGQDARGEAILDAMCAWGMDHRGMQIDPAHPTGQVAITMQGERHRFEILPEQAYDYLDANTAMALPALADAGLWYSGSLLQRSNTAGKLIQAMQGLPVPHFVDVNLRDPWWERAAVLAGLQGVRWLKLNEDELAALGFGGPIEQAAEALRKQMHIELLILTLGAAGAMLFSAGSRVHGEPVPLGQMVDTVGAGDAFSAVMILGVLRAWPLPKTLVRALSFASAQCTRQGAVWQDKQGYQALLAQWERDR